MEIDILFNLFRLYVDKFLSLLSKRIHLSQGIDIKDLQDLYKTRYSRLLNYGRSLIGSKEDVREIINDVFVAVWRNRAHLDKERNLDAYLRRAVKNRCINYLKARKIQSVDIDEKAYYLTNSEDVDQILHFAELKAFMAECIDTLPPKCKQIFILSREENLPHKAIAKKLNLSVKTIENQISIALRKLRKLLEDSHFKTN